MCSSDLNNRIPGKGLEFREAPRMSNVAVESWEYCKLPQSRHDLRRRSSRHPLPPLFGHAEGRGHVLRNGVMYSDPLGN